VPEGDTILWAATRMRPVLEGRQVEVTHTHPRFGRDRWQERLGGHTVTTIETHGKNLLIVFDHELLLHSHLRMSGVWDVRPAGGRWQRAPSRAWLVLRAEGQEVVQYDGPVLELMTAGRRRFDQRLAALGPDILADEFDSSSFLRRLRLTDQQRPIGDALLDQRILAGIGNIWKAESCWEAEVDPWRPVGSLSDDQALALVEGIRPRMLISGTQGHRAVRSRIYRHTGEPCPRCGTAIIARGQGDQNRTTYSCPGCQH
jgi:endonuclease VIII